MAYVASIGSGAGKQLGLGTHIGDWLSIVAILVNYVLTALLFLAFAACGLGLKIIVYSPRQPYVFGETYSLISIHYL